MQGTIFDIKHFAVHDGPGIRQTVFLKGCPLQCTWCHNPESQSLKIELCDIIEKIGSQEFNRKKTVGKSVSVNEVIAEVEKDIAFFDESGGGVTFSGGEPMFQNKFLLELVKNCREKEIHVAVDTSGFASLEAFQEIAPFVDLFLYDLKIIDSEQHLLHTGVVNELILENLKYLDQKGNKVIVRIPLIPTVTATEKNIQDIANFMLELKNINEINLLPYHDISKSKYQRFNKPFLLDSNLSLDTKEIEEIQLFFKSKGFKVKID